MVWRQNRSPSLFGVVANSDPHDGLNVGSGALFFAVPVSTDLTEGEQRYKVAPVRFGAMFLFMQGVPLDIIKENRHVVGYICHHVESKVPELLW